MISEDSSFPLEASRASSARLRESYEADSATFEPKKRLLKSPEAEEWNEGDDEAPAGEYESSA